MKVIPSFLGIVQYFSSCFAKKRKIICCNEKWKQAKIEADAMTEIASDSAIDFRFFHSES